MEFSAQIASLAGVIISLIGFGVTIVNVLKSKNAAEQAQEAAEQTRESIKKYQTVSELSEVAPLVSEIKDLHRRKEWRLLLDRYEQLRRLLCGIRSSGTQLTEEHNEAIQRALADIKEIQNHMEQLENMETKDHNIVRINERLSERSDELYEVLTELTRSQTHGP